MRENKLICKKCGPLRNVPGPGTKKCGPLVKKCGLHFIMRRPLVIRRGLDWICRSASSFSVPLGSTACYRRDARTKLNSLGATKLNSLGATKLNSDAAKLNSDETNLRRK